MRRHAWNCDLSTKPGTDILTNRHIHTYIYNYIYIIIYIYIIWIYIYIYHFCFNVIDHFLLKPYIITFIFIYHKKIRERSIYTHIYIYMLDCKGVRPSPRPCFIFNDHPSRPANWKNAINHWTRNDHAGERGSFFVFFRPTTIHIFVECECFNHAWQKHVFLTGGA